MIRSLDGKTPKVAETAWVSEFAYVVGDIEIGEYSSIWPGVTIRGDGESTISIGNHVNVQENSVIHSDELVIEDYVTIGHSVVLHGLRVGQGSLLGNNCTVLEMSNIGKQCIIAANSVVLAKTNVPDRSFMTDIPAVVKRQATAKQVDGVLEASNILMELAKKFKKSGL